MVKFKIGDKIKTLVPIGWNRTPETQYAIGTVIEIESKTCVGVEFFNHINGHQCSNNGPPLGKYGHCWYCDKSEVEKINITVKDFLRL